MFNCLCATCKWETLIFRFNQISRDYNFISAFFSCFISLHDFFPSLEDTPLRNG